MSACSALGRPPGLIVENFSSFAQLEQPSAVFRALSEPASAGLVTSIGRTVARADSELSYSDLRSSTR